MNGTRRADIKIGMLVNVILKKDQRTGKLTEGIVKAILTSAPVHTRGIKVKLDDGQVGRVLEILPEDDLMHNPTRLRGNHWINQFAIAP